MFCANWNAPSNALPDGVKVWWVDLERGGDPAVLSTEETDRAASFRFERDRRRFIAARIALREVLGRCLGVAPSKVPIVCGSSGKPRIAGEALYFNLSHSGDRALIACSDRHEIGVDLEEIRSEVVNDGVAAQFMSEREIAALRNAAGEDCDRLFFDVWTRKEALVKLHGTGISGDLCALDVPFDRCEGPWTPLCAQQHVALYACAPAPQFSAALAAAR